MGLLLFMVIRLLFIALGVILAVCGGSFFHQRWIYQRNIGFISDILNLSAKSGLYQRMMAIKGMHQSKSSLLSASHFERKSIYGDILILTAKFQI